MITEVCDFPLLLVKIKYSFYSHPTQLLPIRTIKHLRDFKEGALRHIFKVSTGSEITTLLKYKVLNYTLYMFYILTAIKLMVAII